MARARPFGYYVVKAVRVSGWFLLALMVLYICSGYALTGECGFDRTMSARTAEVLHLKLDVPLLVAFVVHAAGAIWLAFRRWGWIKARKRT
jgi:succinate dehydrogenase/fumarate reductase cytochrome b subunit